MFSIVYHRKALKDPQELSRLFRRYLADELSEDEAKELLGRLSAEERESLFLQMIEDSLDNDVESEIRDRPEIREVLSEARKKIDEGIGGTQSVQAGAIRRFRLWGLRVAAVLLCVFTATFFFFRLNRANEDQPLVVTKSTDIRPGGNKAVLTLADGSKISLTDAGRGTLATQQGVSVIKSADGQIIYKVQNGRTYAGSGSDNEPSSFNTIATPRGGQYSVVLPDGSKIWLNASSSISYPVRFNVAERKVVLHGEAYFEVAHLNRQEKGGGKVPFSVITGGQKVEVLGTHFNINGYADEPRVKTTLLEGKVRVSGDGGKPVILLPGQQSQTSRGRQDIRVVNADLKADVAWKNNQFFFEDESIHAIMRQISRWYDVDVVYKDELRGKTVWGSVPRYSNISRVLSVLELTGNVHFKIEGRQVIVMK